MSRVFSFLSTLSVKKIRVILKSWDWRQSGLKEALVAEVMLRLHLSLLSGKRLAETLSMHEITNRYQSWLRVRLSKDENYPVSIDRAPNEEKLVALLSNFETIEYRRKKVSINRPRPEMPRQDSQDSQRAIHDDDSVANESQNERDGPTQPQSDQYEPNGPNVQNDSAQNNQPQNERNPTNLTNNGNTENTQFGINEFAPLLITIRDDEHARSAVIAMGQELSRAQLDAGVTRGDFWAVVESRFNDVTQRRVLNLTGSVDDVDSSLPPLAHRTSTFLKDKFNDANTQYVTDWSASGQNDPDRFRNFLPKLPSGELNALGKRIMVMFVCTRKGTRYEEEHFSNVCCKLIPGSAGRDEGS